MRNNIFRLFFVSRRTLLYIASVVWAYAGVMLVSKGATVVIASSSYVASKIIIAILCAALFYYFMFRRISLKHIERIKALPEDSTPFYGFFNRKSYFMMLGMISIGVLLRKTGIVPLAYLSVFYICMGLPLLFSSIRFFFHAIRYRKAS